MAQIYISIGNSDNHLPQVEWATFVLDLADCVTRLGGKVHGEWYSESASPFQNACFCLDEPADSLPLQRSLKRLAAKYRQKSIAYAIVNHTLFLTPGD